MKTNFYIDGFNLYYGSLENTPHEWLDVVDFCWKSFPGPANQLDRVRYFTARVKAYPGDPIQPVRPAAYLRALATLPEVEIHYGQYNATQVHMKLVAPPPGGDPFALVHESEEKGSDVNIATYLLLDAFRDDFDVAVVVSDQRWPSAAFRASLGAFVRTTSDPGSAGLADSGALPAPEPGG